MVVKVSHRIAAYAREHPQATIKDIAEVFAVRLFPSI